MRKSENPGLFNLYPTRRGAAQKQFTGDVLEYSKGGGQDWLGHPPVEFVEVNVTLSSSLSDPQNWTREILLHKGFP